MLGGGVADRLESEPPQSLVDPDVAVFARRADLFVLNLECCISERGAPWPAPEKPFFFRAPPAAVDLLTHLNVSCVTLANNHALDFGEEALRDTLTFLDSAGIAHVGAGPDLDAARAPAMLDANGFRVDVVGLADHPKDFAAGPERSGIAYTDLGAGAARPPGGGDPGRGGSHAGGRSLRPCLPRRRGERPVRPRGLPRRLRRGSHPPQRPRPPVAGHAGPGRVPADRGTAAVAGLLPHPYGHRRRR